MMELVNKLSDLQKYYLTIGGIGVTLTAASIGLLSYFYFNKKDKKLIRPIDLNNQSIILDEVEGIRCSVFCPDGKFQTNYKEGINTVYDSFCHGLKLSTNDPCLGWRTSDKSPYHWMTYNEVHEHAWNIGSALVNYLKVNPTNTTYISIYGQNSKEWFISELASLMFSMIVVPLYDTLGADALSHIIAQTEVQVIFCENNVKLKRLLQGQSQITMQVVKHIVLFELIDEESKQTIKQQHPHIQLHTFHDLLEIGKSNRHAIVAPQADDIFTVCYTSGTTGIPKGVLISHRNLISDLVCNVGLYHDTGALHFSKNDYHISYLPLAHMFEQAAHVFLFLNGGRIGYYRGDIRGLMSDIAELKPTFFCAVPRILNRIYDKVIMKFNSNFILGKLLQWAIASKMNDLKRGVIRQDTIWDRLFFSKIRNLVGGRVQIILTGSAPISSEVMDFLRAAFSCHIVEGYGQTECTAAVTCTLPGEYLAGHVGAPIACNHVKLANVPDMDIDWRRDGRGEICVRGQNCTRGYLKQTESAIDSDGWLHTGDIGLWTERGTLQVVDRCKHMFKLCQGEYIAPEKIEQCLLHSSLIAQIFVDGNSLHAFCIAIVVPDFEVVLPVDKVNDEVAQQQLCQDAGFKQKVVTNLNEVGRRAGLNGFEMVKNIHLTSTPFSIENGLLTPTMKIKRGQMRQHFADVINQLYSNVSIS